MHKHALPEPIQAAALTQVYVGHDLWPIPDPRSPGRQIPAPRDVAHWQGDWGVWFEAGPVTLMISRDNARHLMNYLISAPWAPLQPTRQQAGVPGAVRGRRLTRATRPSDPQNHFLATDLRSMINVSLTAQVTGGQVTGGQLKLRLSGWENLWNWPGLTSCCLSAAQAQTLRRQLSATLRELDQIPVWPPVNLDLVRALRAGAGITRGELKFTAERCDFPGQGPGLRAAAKLGHTQAATGLKIGGQWRWSVPVDEGRQEGDPPGRLPIIEELIERHLGELEGRLRGARLAGLI